MTSVIDFAQKRAEKNFFTRTLPDLPMMQVYLMIRPASIEYLLEGQMESESLGSLYYDTTSETEFFAIRTMHGFRPVIEGTEKIRDTLRERIATTTCTWQEPRIIIGTDCLSLYQGVQNGTKVEYDLLEKTPSKLYALGDNLLEEEDFIREYHN